ncbi:cytochrome P450 [Halorussus caseinilyticus]|uniref:cytochrome P450 n=1 Tax=Halorussus caseinilyticus TaxID=3034025 RepID=UPI0023E874C7|nr:cytochrome P450 [Halorussus sp. DT72]
MKQSKPPGPDGVPLLGNAIDYVKNPFEFREECTEKYGGLIYTEAGSKPMYMVTDPKYIEEVLVTKNEKFLKPQLMQKRLNKVFGDGLLLSEGDFWRKNREVAQPAFYSDRVTDYADTMVEHAERTVEKWTPGETYDIAHEMERLAVEILMEALFNQDREFEESAIGEAVHSISEKYDPTNPSWYVPNWVPTPVNRQYEGAVENLEDDVDDIVRHRKENDENPDDLLKLLLEAKNDDDHQMDGDLLRDEINTILLGGSGPMGLALTYSWYLLSKNPEKREKLTDELDEILGGDSPTVEDVREFEYTEWVLKESMRLYPPVWTLGREPSEDVEIGGYTIPEGAAVNLTPWSVHRDSAHYDDPEAFRPERWAEEVADERPEYSYFPFGGGPRQCIGRHFSMLQGQLVLSTLAQEYELELVSDEDLDLKISTIIEPKDGIDMVVRERE